MTAYDVGARFERKCQDSLQEKGWRVWRVAGSHSESDLIACRPCFEDHTDLFGQWMLVQCKKSGKLYGAEKLHFKDVAEECGATAMLAKAGKNGRGIEWVAL